MSEKERFVAKDRGKANHAPIQIVFSVRAKVGLYRLDQNQGHHRGHQVQECRHHLGRRVQDHQLVPELRLCGWLRAGWTAGIMGEFCLGGIPQISQVFHRLCPENITDENTCNATTDI